jgi:hypothetical protein
LVGMVRLRTKSHGVLLFCLLERDTAEFGTSTLSTILYGVTSKTIVIMSCCYFDCLRIVTIHAKSKVDAMFNSLRNTSQNYTGEYR